MVLGLRISTLANYGRLPVNLRALHPTDLYAHVIAGVYKDPSIYCEVKAVFTNTRPVDAYRGDGRLEATYLLERLVDVLRHDTVSIRLSCGGRISSPQMPSRTRAGGRGIRKWITRERQ